MARLCGEKGRNEGRGERGRKHAAAHCRGTMMLGTSGGAASSRAGNGSWVHTLERERCRETVRCGSKMKWGWEWTRGGKEGGSNFGGNIHHPPCTCLHR